MAESDHGDGDRDEKVARLYRDIVMRAPISIWASHGEGENYSIVAWNEGAQEIYGFSEEEAVGSNYLNLFISDKERKQSAEDCDFVIVGEVFRNFVAIDHASDGSPRTMITNCYRVFDESSGKYLQVEIALDVSDLELFSETEAELRELREIGLAQKRAREMGKAGAEIVDLNAKLRAKNKIIANARNILEDLAEIEGLDEHDRLKIDRLIRRIDRQQD